MTEEVEKVAPLKKVRLSLEAGTDRETADLTDGTLFFEFIVGIGKEGMSPFEIQLLEKRPGDAIKLHLHGNELSALLEHLTPSFPYNPQTGAPFHLNIHILEIKTPESREIVRAMAASTGCGGGCCGHHP